MSKLRGVLPWATALVFLVVAGFAWAPVRADEVSIDVIKAEAL